MKKIRFLITAGTIILFLSAGHPAIGQSPWPNRHAQPEEKWDVKKEFDEHGNLIYYDSSYSRTWKHFDFPGQGDWHTLEDLDSILGDFFRYPEGIFRNDPFSFSPFSHFMDSLNMDFYCDSSLFQRPFGLGSLRHFQDSAWMDRFFPDSMFQDAFVPLEEFFPPSFHGPEGFFDKHQELREKFWQEFSFPGDTLHRFDPKWQQLPGQQKNRPGGIEI